MLAPYLSAPQSSYAPRSPPLTYPVTPSSTRAVLVAATFTARRLRHVAEISVKVRQGAGWLRVHRSERSCCVQATQEKDSTARLMVKHRDPKILAVLFAKS